MAEKKLLGTTKLSKNYQLTLPKDAAEAIGAGPGDMIGYYLEGEKVAIRKVRVIEDESFYATYEKVGSPVMADPYFPPEKKKK